MQVPGFTHPVTDMYLEDILKLIGYQDALLGASAQPAHLNGHSKPQHAGATLLARHQILRVQHERMRVAVTIKSVLRSRALAVAALSKRYAALWNCFRPDRAWSQCAGKAPIVAVPPKQRQAIEDAIMAAFLAGTDDNFDKLLEVSSPAQRSFGTLDAHPLQPSLLMKEWTDLAWIQMMLR